MKHKGSCHCGRIAFEVDGDIEQVIECNCSYCSRKGSLLWFTTRERFQLETPESNLSTYTFNQHVIQHQFCAHCGVAPFSSGKDRKGVETVAINVRCLPDLDRSKLKIEPFDGRSL